MNIKKGNKVTLAGLSEFGFPVIRETTIHSIEEKDNKLIIIHRPKRKRRYFKKTVSKSGEFFIFEGWNLDIDTNWFKSKSKTGLNISYPCFDKRYIEQIKNTKTDKQMLTF